MQDKNEIRLTAPEMSALWTQFINDSASLCMLKYFLHNVKDREIKPIVEFALQASVSHLNFLRELFQREKFPEPIGFTKNDVEVEAPMLFTDIFVMMYLRNMSVLSMSASAVTLGMVTREDVVAFHKTVLKDAIRLQDLTRRNMLKQGTYVRPPSISTPDKVDFVEKQQFLAGFFGERRSLSTIEITHLFNNVQTNAIGKTLIIGLAQVAEKEEVVNFLLRGKAIAQKHVEVFSKILTDNDLPAPMLWDAAVTDSRDRVFSDKLIMFHVTSMIAAGIGNYGAAMAASPRRDIAMKYATYIPEISLYAEDGANIMIDHGWLEEPPLADDRNKLARE